MNPLSVIVLFLQIERQRQEHLKPRLHLKEIQSPPVPIVRSPVQRQPEKEARESSPEEAKHVKLPKMQATLRPVEQPMPESRSGSQSRSESASPLAEEDSRMSGNSDDNSHQRNGPVTKEEASKLGFSSLKLGTGKNHVIYRF